MSKKLDLSDPMASARIQTTVERLQKKRNELLNQRDLKKRELERIENNIGLQKEKFDKIRFETSDKDLKLVIEEDKEKLELLKEDFRKLQENVVSLRAVIEKVVFKLCEEKKKKNSLMSKKEKAMKDLEKLNFVVSSLKNGLPYSERIRNAKREYKKKENAFLTQKEALLNELDHNKTELSLILKSENNGHSEVNEKMNQIAELEGRIDRRSDTIRSLADSNNQASTHLSELITENQKRQEENMRLTKYLEDIKAEMLQIENTLVTANNLYLQRKSKLRKITLSLEKLGTELKNRLDSTKSQTIDEFKDAKKSILDEIVRAKSQIDEQKRKNQLLSQKIDTAKEIGKEKNLEYESIQKKHEIDLQTMKERNENMQRVINTFLVIPE